MLRLPAQAPARAGQSVPDPFKNPIQKERIP